MKFLIGVKSDVNLALKDMIRHQGQRIVPVKEHYHLDIYIYIYIRML